LEGEGDPCAVTSICSIVDIRVYEVPLDAEVAPRGSQSIRETIV